MNGKQFFAGILLALPLSVMAVPIDGEIGMSGNLLPNCSGGEDPCDFDDADGLDFGSNGFGTDAAFLVTFATGDFAADGIGFGDTGTITDFQFDPLSPVPVDPLWTITGGGNTWEFALETVNINLAAGNFVDLSGTGTLSAAGFDDTNGTWTLSADAAGSTFSWSSTTVAPEPGILLVFGAGLFGLIAARRFRR